MLLLYRIFIPFILFVIYLIRYLLTAPRVIPLTFGILSLVTTFKGIRLLSFVIYLLDTIRLSPSWRRSKSEVKVITFEIYRLRYRKRTQFKKIARAIEQGRSSLQKSDKLERTDVASFSNPFLSNKFNVPPLKTTNSPFFINELLTNVRLFTFSLDQTL